jgi:hypothetical protein
MYASCKRIKLNIVDYIETEIEVNVSDNVSIYIKLWKSSPLKKRSISFRK